MKLRSNSRVAVCIILMFGFLLGIDNGGFQYIVLKIANEYGINQTHMGMLISIKYIAMMLGPIAGGIISDRAGRWQGILCTGIIVCLSSFLCSIPTPYVLLCVAVFCIGFGAGSMESSCMAVLSVYREGGSGKYLSMFQGFLSWGSVSGPLLGSFIIDNLRLNWRCEYFVISFCALLGIAALIIIRRSSVFENQIKTKVLTEDNPGLKIKGKNGLIIGGTFICVLIYMFMENGVTFFSDSFFSIVLEKPQYSALALSLFWAMMAVSRLFISMLHRNRNRIIPACFLLGGGAAFMIGRLDNAVIAVAAVALSGLFFGPLWAFMLSIDTDRFPERPGLVTSIFMAFSGAGGMISPAVMGIISDSAGLRTVFMVIAGMCAASFAVYIAAIYRYEKDKHAVPVFPINNQNKEI